MFYDRAVFAFYWERPDGDPVALYNVLDPSSPLYRSTVSAQTLVANGFSIPLTPLPPAVAQQLIAEVTHGS
jgi:hypothetical protein